MYYTANYNSVWTSSWLFSVLHAANGVSLGGITPLRTDCIVSITNPLSPSWPQPSPLHVRLVSGTWGLCLDVERRGCRSKAGQKRRIGRSRYKKERALSASWGRAPVGQWAPSLCRNIRIQCSRTLSQSVSISWEKEEKCFYGTKVKEDFFIKVQPPINYKHTNFNRKQQQQKPGEKQWILLPHKR